MSDPEDIFEQVHEGTGSNLPAKQSNRNITKSSIRIDESVQTIEDKVTYWQELINHWRITIIQNERVIIIFCIVFGFFYSYAINECTGNIHIPAYSYVMIASIIVLLSLLLITEGALPLVVLVKFAISVAGGHVSMMLLIAADGHTWNLFTTAVCRYPISSDSIMVYLVGGGSGYIFAKFEEIRTSGREK